MNLSLKVHYRLAAIPMIRSFVVESAVYYGADSKEVFELGMAAEEAAEHIITTYPAAEADAPFDIFCEEKDDFLRFVFSNTGLPVNVDAIPEYDVSNPETSIDGLQFFLLEKLTDNFRFVNLGTGGWQTILDKKLKCLKTHGLENSGNTEVESSLPSKKLEFSVAAPEDAYEITKLAYYTYRYSYAKKAFYYPELLQEELAKQHIISLIVSDENGMAVPGSGMCDLFIYPGYRFKCVDAMITNFHLPQSTLLMLVSAFYSREKMLDIYELAKNKGHRFFSYGDAMLIE